MMIFNKLLIVTILILGSLSLEQSVLGQGSSFQQQEIDEIQEIVSQMQDQLNNLHVSWGNVTAKPSGFDNDTNVGLFQSSTSIDEEPCNIGDIVTWTGMWNCLPLSLLWEDIQNKPAGFEDDIDNDLLSEISCTLDQIIKWNGTDWICMDETTGSIYSEFVLELGSGAVTNAEYPQFEVLQDFKITNLPSSTKEYSIPVDLMTIESDMAVDFGTFEIFLQESSDGRFSRLLFIETDETALNYRTSNHIIENENKISILPHTDEKFFRIISNTFDRDSFVPTGSYENLRFVMNLDLPDGAIYEIIP